jgi:hypothetical protein
MYPAFVLELRHDRINEWITCFRIFPGSEEDVIIIPFYLFTDRVVMDFIEIWSIGSVKVEELSPD